MIYSEITILQFLLSIHFVSFKLNLLKKVCLNPDSQSLELYNGTLPRIPKPLSINLFLYDLKLIEVARKRQRMNNYDLFVQNEPEQQVTFIVSYSTVSFFQIERIS